MHSVQPACPYTSLPPSLLLRLDAFVTLFVGIKGVNIENTEDAQSELSHFST